MNDTNSQTAAEEARKAPRRTPAQFEDAATETTKALREFTERNRAQTREVYERYKDAVEAALGTLEKSLVAASEGATALNRKLIDIFRRNVESSFDLAKSLAETKNLAEAMEVQTDYWRKQLDALAVQAEEIRTLSAKVTTDTTEPITAHVTRGIEELRKAG
jgi:phasin